MLSPLPQAEDVAAFKDMSRLRFLVVDEADRIVEEGHFPELHRVFSRIRDHEKIAQQGQVPAEVYARRREGSYDPEDAAAFRTQALPSAEAMAACRKLAARLGRSALTDEDLRREGVDSMGLEGPGVGVCEEDEEEEEEKADEEGGSLDAMLGLGLDEDEELEARERRMFDRMPTEAELMEARRSTPAVPYEDDEEGGRGRGRGTSGGKGGRRGKVGKEGGEALVGPPAVVLRRQTLLYSATALASQVQTGHVSSKKQRKVRGLAGEGVQCLPYHMQQLLATVALEASRSVRVIDVTGAAQTAKAKELEQGGKGGKGAKAAVQADSRETAGLASAVTLPQGLTQLQAWVPAEDKDALAYWYLQQVAGRTLLFVNSIKVVIGKG